MTTRKPKPKSTLLPQIEPLTEKLQLVVATAEHKAPVRASWTWQAETEAPAERSLPKRSKIVLH
jgi:hypothetical protein